MSGRSRMATTALALGALALGACGQASDDPGAARGAVASFLYNCSRGRGDLAMELVTTPARAVFVDAPGTAAACARILKAPVTNLAAARIVDVHAEDSTASAAVALSDGGTALVSLSFGQEGQWQIEGPH